MSAAKRSPRTTKRPAKTAKRGVDAALDYASMGIHVFPCNADKAPRVLWRDESTTDPNTIRAWLCKWPKAAIGVDCEKSGLVVVDLDVKNGVNGVKSWRAYLEGREVPKTYNVRTPSGGWHGWYRDPNSRFKTCAGIAPGVDVRAVGGYVIAPGSKRYRWSSGKAPKRLDDISVMPSGILPERASGANGGHWSTLDRSRLDPRDREALESLEALGGHSAYQAGDYVTITRPDKTAGASASIGHLGPGVVKVFTSNWPPLVGGQVYDADELATIADEPEATNQSGWSREVDLADALDGEPPPKPTVGRWDDRALFYPNEVHSVFGEPESLKSWLLLHAADQELAAGDHVLYYDLESNDRSIVARLRDLGASSAAIADRFHYFRPEGRITSNDHERIVALVDRYRPTLVVLDGITEAMAIQGLSTGPAEDVARWFRIVSRRFLVSPTDDYPGPAVVELDHVVKSKDDRNGWAFGSQHKKAGIKGAAYHVRVVSPFGRGRHGVSRVFLSKDSPGGVRWDPYGRPRQRLVAEFRCESREDGTVDAYLATSLPSEAGQVEDVPLAETIEFRQLMERVWKYISNNPSCSTNSVRAGVSGKAEKISIALDLLSEGGWIRNEGSGNAKKWAMAKHFSAVKLSGNSGDSGDGE